MAPGPGDPHKECCHAEFRPRNPIVKENEDDSDEVEGHAMHDARRFADGSISVIEDEGRDPVQFDANPTPPVEFGAPGLDIRVPWQERGYITATGNSFANPHFTGLTARNLAKHPGLTVFQLNTIFSALAAKATSDA